MSDLASVIALVPFLGIAVLMQFRRTFDSNPFNGLEDLDFAADEVIVLPCSKVDIFGEPLKSP